MGDSPFELAEVRGLEQPSGAMVPKSVLNDLRRQAVQQLLELRGDPDRRRVADPTRWHRRHEIAVRYGRPGGAPRILPNPSEEASGP